MVWLARNLSLYFLRPCMLLQEQLYHGLFNWGGFSFDVMKSEGGALQTNSLAVWPDWVTYWTSGNFLKPLATINLPKSPTFLGNFCKGVKNFNFLVKSFLGNFYRYLVIFTGHTGPYVVSTTWRCWFEVPLPFLWMLHECVLRFWSQTILALL